MRPSTSLATALEAVQVREPPRTARHRPSPNHLLTPSLPFSSIGVCLSTSACTSAGGTTINGACPADANDIKCCSKLACGSSSAGNCRWASDCAGTSASNQCPGPSSFKCCSSSAQGWGGYGTPSYPSTSSGCKQVAIDGAKKIVAAWPGRVREIGCIRQCACGSGSDHCCGKATDMMCSDAGGVSSFSLSAGTSRGRRKTVSTTVLDMHG